MKEYNYFNILGDTFKSQLYWIIEKAGLLNPSTFNGLLVVLAVFILFLLVFIFVKFIR
jgi:hypothetical protein